MRSATAIKPSPEGHRKRLRERFQKAGRNSFAEHELLELLLTYSIPRKDTKPAAKNLLHQFGSLIGVLQQPEERLTKIQGIGINTAFFLKIVHAYLTRCMESAIEEQSALKGPEDIFAYIRMNLGARTNECAYALYLDKANRIVHHAEIASGTVDKAAIYPREVLKPALVHNATGLVLVHNHPAGCPVPSEEDIRITKKIEDIAVSLGISLVDHLIVTRTQAYSLKTGKLL
jgi:DNA repair protein RadC